MNHSSISSRTSIHNEHRVVDVTEETKSFQLQEYYYNDDLTTFKTIKTFLPIAISEDYKRNLPDDFFENIFSQCDDNFVVDNSLSDEDILQNRNCYSKDIESLCSVLKKIIKPYVAIAWTDKDFNKFEKHEFVINNNLVPKNNPDVGTERAGDLHYPVKDKMIYDEIPSVTDRIKSQKLVLKAREDIETILFALSKLSNLSAYSSKNNNSYRIFTSDIITKMYGNINQLYPRSIVNYSAFQFCIKDYPFDTKSGRIYSISNVTSSVKNKFELIDVFYKNLDAIISFLNDLEWLEKTDDNVLKYETQVLKNAYGICIGLCAFIGEEEYYRKILTTSLDGNLLDSHTTIGSIFFNRINKKTNEVHE